MEAVARFILYFGVIMIVGFAFAGGLRERPDGRRRQPVSQRKQGSWDKSNMLAETTVEQMKREGPTHQEIF